MGEGGLEDPWGNSCMKGAHTDGKAARTPYPLELLPKRVIEVVVVVVTGIAKKKVHALF